MGVVPGQIIDPERHDSCLYNLKAVEERFRLESDRVHVPDEETLVQIVENDQKPSFISSSSELQSYLETSQGFAGIRIVNVHQQSSVGRLVISSAATQLLVSRLSFFPPFLELLNSFGRKETHAPRALPSLAERRGEIGSGPEECCYLLKFAEQHERDNGHVQWSIRQTGVYIQTNAIARQSTVVLLRSTQSIRQRYRDLSRDHPLDVADVETLILSTSCANWNDYMDETEVEINTITASAFATFGGNNPSPQGLPENHRHGIEARPHDFHRLVYLAQRLEAIHCAMAHNVDVLGKRCAKLEKSASSQRGETLQTVSSGLLLRATSLRERIALTIDLVRSTLDIRNSQRSMDVASLARQDSTTTLELSRRAVDDSQALKIISILTLFYLPASFVASFLDMDYIHIVHDKPLGLKIDPEFVIFVTITIILLLLTVAIWFWYSYVQHSKQRRKEETLALSLP